MAEQNEQLMLNTLKRKLSSNDLGIIDFPTKRALLGSSSENLSSSSVYSLIQKFLVEEHHKGQLNIVSLNQCFQISWWHRQTLLFQFLKIVAKIIYHKGDKDQLKYVLQDIEDICIDILGLPNIPDNIYTTIVTSALQVSKDRKVIADKDNAVVKVEPKPEKGIVSAIIDFAVKIVVKILFPDLPDNPNMFLEGDFAPIREETSPTSDLKIIGDIPANLNGMMIRNGPDPLFDPVAKYSCMLHAIRFKEGKATYVSRYVQTSRLKQERFFEKAEFLKYGDLQGKFGLFMSCVQLLRAKLEILDVSYGWLNADTGLIYHDGMVMALQDFDKPYVVNVSHDGDLQTLGINDYNNRLTHSVIPHPKKDPVTGELFIVGVSYTPPYAIYNYVTKQGVMNDPVPITMSGPSYMHDLGITKNYVIFMDLPFCYNPEHMVKEDDWVYMFAAEKKPRFGILPRYAKSEEKIKWFEFDNPFFIFHNGNSWEEDDDTIVLISCTMKPNNAHTLHSSTSQTNTGVFTSFSLRNLRGSEVPKKTKLFFSPAHVYNGPTRRNFNPAHVYNGPSLLGIQTFMGSNNIDDNNNVTSENSSDSLQYEAVELTLPTVYKYTFNMKTGETSQKQLFRTPCDFPKINQSYIGKRSRYLYTSECDHLAKITSIVKSDLERSLELKLQFGDNKYGSEVAFVSRQLDSPSAEDDGYLTTFVHDEEKSVSFAYVIDARRMELSAMIELPNRVPYGFHATFVTEDEIQAQNLLR
ncbi:oxygenase [Lithospermum erythrorhizon]|uniref:carotenoid 9,10-dioxygenase n=1 Tax=Lithospermum erythrorhizon TaxID=34254 RepID=A0AAV3P796_LITER